MLAGNYKAGTQKKYTCTTQPRPNDDGTAAAAGRRQPNAAQLVHARDQATLEGFQATCSSVQWVQGPDHGDLHGRLRALLDHSWHQQQNARFGIQPGVALYSDTQAFFQCGCPDQEHLLFITPQHLIDRIKRSVRRDPVYECHTTHCSGRVQAGNTTTVATSLERSLAHSLPWLCRRMLRLFRKHLERLEAELRDQDQVITHVPTGTHGAAAQPARPKPQLAAIRQRLQELREAEDQEVHHVAEARILRGRPKSAPDISIMRPFGGPTRAAAQQLAHALQLQEQQDLEGELRRRRLHRKGRQRQKLHTSKARPKHKQAAMHAMPVRVPGAADSQGTDSGEELAESGSADSSSSSSSSSSADLGQDERAGSGGAEGVGSGSGSDSASSGQDAPRASQRRPQSSGSLCLTRCTSRRRRRAGGPDPDCPFGCAWQVGGSWGWMQAGKGRCKWPTGL